MKVFLSWSGERSRKLAEVLREWLPNVLQAVEPWMSAEDVDKGARWSSDIAAELAETKVGILCLTPENLEAPWLLFEAGALSKTLEKPFVSPYLLGLKPTEMKGPLVQFQATVADHDDTRRLLSTLNKALGENALADKQLEKIFKVWWPELEGQLAGLLSTEASRGPIRSDRELLEEILQLARSQARRNESDQLELSLTPTFPAVPKFDAHALFQALGSSSPFEDEKSRLIAGLSEIFDQHGASNDRGRETPPRT